MTREEAINELIEMCKYINGNIEIRSKQYKALNMAIEALKQPEIIRCAGCHYYADGHCDMHHMGTSPDDYCSYAVGKYNI